MRAAHRDLPVTEGDPLSSTIDAGDLTAAARSREALLWAGAIAVALGLLVVLFSDAIAWLTLRWQEPEYSHGWFIPIVSLFLLWQRRRHILASRSAGSWWGVVLVTIGIALLSLRALVLMHLLPAVGFAVTLMGLGVAALGGASMRYAWMPLAFLLFALPPPAGVQVMLSTELQLISSQLGAQLLDWFGVSVFLDGNVIDLGVYKLQVAEACSGLRYLFPLASFAFLAACFFRAPVWARAAVFLSVVPITVVMNSVRIAATGLLIQYGSIESAEGLLHIFEGWVVFVAALALLFAVMALLGKLNRPSTRLSDLLDFERMGAGAPPAAPAPPGVPRPGHPGPPFVACLGLLLATPLALGWLGDRPEAIPRRPGLLTFPLQLDQWQGRILPVDPDVLGVLDADDYLLADFGAPGVDTPVNLWVAYYDFAGRSHPDDHSQPAGLPTGNRLGVREPRDDPGHAGRRRRGAFRGQPSGDRQGRRAHGHALLVRATRPPSEQRVLDEVLRARRQLHHASFGRRTTAAHDPDCAGRDGPRGHREAVGLPPGRPSPARAPRRHVSPRWAREETDMLLMLAHRWKRGTAARRAPATPGQGAQEA